MKWKNETRIFVGFILTVLCIWLAFRKVSVTDLTQVISGGNYYWLIPAALAQLITILVRSWRWLILLDREDKLKASIWAQGIGYLFTNLFPFRLGEVARILVMSKKCKLPVAQVAGTAFVERLLDVATIILALILVLPWMRVPMAIIKSGQLFGIVVLLGVLLIILLAQFRDISSALIKRVTTALPFLPQAMILARWEELLQGLTPLLRGLVTSKVIALSLLSWLFSSIVFFCAIRTFQPAGRFLEAIFMMVSLSLAVIVPSSPGFIGVFQLVGQQALVIPFDEKYSVSNALAITLIAHLVYYVLSTLIGIIGLWRVGQSFSDLMQQIGHTRVEA